jgi:hypothetical protein
MHDREKYLVSLDRICRKTGVSLESDEFSGADGHNPCTLRDARVIAHRAMAEHTKLGTVVQVSRCDEGPAEGLGVESWERVRKSKKHPTGWKYEKG